MAGTKATIEEMANQRSRAIRHAFDQRRQQLRHQGLAEAVTLAGLTDDIGELHRRLSANRAQLQELRENPPQLDLDQAAEELRFIRRLPGVSSVRVNECGETIVSFRTACLYKGLAFYLGSYDLIMPVAGTGGAYFRLECTRSGLLNRPAGKSGYERPFYWEAKPQNGYLGPGYFCFGSRDSQIATFWKERRISEFVHLVIATMSMVNPEHWDQVPLRYRYRSLTQAQRDNWRYARSPYDREPTNREGSSLRATSNNSGGRTASATAEALARVFMARVQRDHDERIDMLMRQIRGDERYLADLTDDITDAHRRQGLTRAELDELERRVPDSDPDRIAQELRFISRLPGVRGVRLKNGVEIVVSFRTACLYKGRRYLMGDFDLIMPVPVGDPLPDYSLNCTRSWIRKNQREPIYEDGPYVTRDDRKVIRYEIYYADPLYWNGENEDSSGEGEFCFGFEERGELIEKLWEENRIGEFAHLVIATMNVVNDSDWDMVPGIFRSTRLTPLQIANWQFGRSPYDREPVA